MKFVYQLVWISIAVNFAVGIMLSLFPMFNDYPTATQGFDNYNAQYGANITGELSDTVSPSGVAENKGDAIYRVLDTIGVGYIQRLVGVIHQYMFGFTTLLERIFGGFLGPDLSGKIFGALNVAISIAYGVAIYEAWTGKRMED